MADTSNDVEVAIRKAFRRLGYPDPKEEQLKAAREFISGRDVFVCLPTGSGKSMCYGCLLYAFDELASNTFSDPTTNAEPSAIVLIVSPLTALMEDQVKKFMDMGLKAAFIGEAQDDPSVERGVISGGYSLVYMSLESMMTVLQWREMFRSQLYQQRLKGIVIDEAHCVEKWGQTFRREFSHIGEMRSLVPPSVNMMALTATATTATRQKIVRALCMKRCYSITTNPQKENVFYAVQEKTDLQEAFTPIVEELILKKKEAPRRIIFCRTYNDCHSVYLFFKHSLKEKLYYPPGALKVSKYRLLDMYTACTATSVKKNILNNFTAVDGVCRVVIATIAFGMGLDSPDVRTALHWGPSADIESYVQESGRIGRDGEKALAKLFYTPRDLTSKFVSDDVKAYCSNHDKLCRRELLFKQFDYYSKFNGLLHDCCDVCAPKCACSTCNF